MLDRLADWLDQQPRTRRRLYSLFIAIILLTLPCYASGVLLLVISDAEPAPAVPTVEPGAAPTTMVGTANPDMAASPTAIRRRPTRPVLAASPTAARPVLPPPTGVPTLILATDTPVVPATAVPIPTATEPPTEAPAPTNTRVDFVPIITSEPVLPAPILTPRVTPTSP